MPRTAAQQDETMASIIQQVQQAINGLMQQVRALNTAVEQQRGSMTGFDEMRATLAAIQVEVSNYRNLPTAGAANLALINPKDLKVKLDRLDLRDHRGLWDPKEIKVHKVHQVLLARRDLA